MSYLITKSDGTLIRTLPAQTLDSLTTSVTLVGQGTANYGQYLNNDLVHLLENFANSSAPNAPIRGQLWWDTAHSMFKVYTGTTWIALRPDADPSNAGMQTLTIGTTPSIVMLLSDGKVIATVSDSNVAKSSMPPQITFRETAYSFQSKFTNGIRTGITLSDDVQLDLNENSNVLVTAQWVKAQGYGAGGGGGSGPTGPTGATGPTGPSGSSALSGDTDVALTSPTTGDWLYYDGSHWVNTRPSHGFGLNSGSTTLANSQILGYYKSPLAFTIPANFGTTKDGMVSQCSAVFLPTGAPVLTIDQCPAASNPSVGGNWTNIGSITFSSGTFTTTFATVSGTSKAIAQGDILRVVGPSSADATLAGIMLSIVGDR